MNEDWEYLWSDYDHTSIMLLFVYPSPELMCGTPHIIEMRQVAFGKSMGVGRSAEYRYSRRRGRCSC
jgi:hypothetical protein